MDTTSTVDRTRSDIKAILVRFYRLLPGVVAVERGGWSWRKREIGALERTNEESWGFISSPWQAGQAFTACTCLEDKGGWRQFVSGLTVRQYCLHPKRSRRLLTTFVIPVPPRPTTRTLRAELKAFFSPHH